MRNYKVRIITDWFELLGGWIPAMDYIRGDGATCLLRRVKK